MTPPEDALSELGVTELQRIAGGWQSVAVCSGRVEGRKVAVKVVDPGADRSVLEARVEAVARLAEETRLVCGPVAVAGRLVNEIGAGIVVAYEFAEGDGPDVGDPEDAARMGLVLAELHRVMARLPAYDLPGLTAFPAAGGSDRQLLHGDFGTRNLRGWRVFDFDDCGYGAVELDLANSLYFVLFGALREEAPGRYERFRTRFLDGYGDRPPDHVLDALIASRVQTLQAWLDEPATGPPGVRDAPEDWRATLRGFVVRYFTG